MPLPEVIRARIQPGDDFEFQSLVSVEGCYIIHVDYTVEQISLKLNLAPEYNPRWHTVRIKAEGTVEEREGEIRRILALNDCDPLPVSNAGGVTIVVYCCGMHPPIDYDMRTLVGMLDIDMIMVLEAPGSIDIHREYLRELGFIRQVQVQGHPSGHVWLVDRGPFLEVDTNMLGNEELTVNLTRRGYVHLINTVFRRR